jgi:F-type H+-transporting ATPase subunit a
MSGMNRADTSGNIEAATEVVGGAEAHSAGQAHNPMEQFLIKPIYDLKLAGYDLAFTNASLFMILAVVFTVLLLYGGIRKKALIPGRWQSVSELSYEFIANTLRDNAGEKSKKFLPFIFTLFMFVLMCNLLGMIPGSFTVTSHIAVTFTFAAFIFIAVTLIGFAVHGLHYLRLFLPHGTPWLLAPLLVLIELASYFARPVSLSVRLAGNMVAGHTLLKIFAMFCGMLVTATAMWVKPIAILPLGLTVIFTAFEFLVACLQAYIFAVLTCVYLNDALNMH